MSPVDWAGPVSEILPYLWIFVKFSMCSYKRAGWLGSRDLGFSTWDLGKRAENFAIWTLQPGYQDESGMNSSNEFCIVLHCLLYFPHHKHPIQLQWYSYKSCQSYNRRESYNFVFHRVCFVSRISCHNSSSAFLISETRAEISHMNPR